MGEHIRDISVNLLSQPRGKFSSGSMEFLLSTFPAIFARWWVTFYSSQWSYLVATICSLYQKVVREWIINSLSYIPWTSQGFLQEKLCKANTWQRAQHTPDVVSLLFEIRIGTGKNDSWISIRATNVPAVIAAAAVASGANFKLTNAFNLEFLGTEIVCTTVKHNHVGRIAEF